MCIHRGDDRGAAQSLCPQYDDLLRGSGCFRQRPGSPRNRVALFGGLLRRRGWTCPTDRPGTASAHEECRGAGRRRFFEERLRTTRPGDRHHGCGVGGTIALGSSWRAPRCSRKRPDGSRGDGHDRRCRHRGAERRRPARDHRQVPGLSRDERLHRRRSRRRGLRRHRTALGVADREVLSRYRDGAREALGACGASCRLVAQGPSARTRGTRSNR